MTLPLTIKTQTDTLALQAAGFQITDKDTFDQATIINGNLKTLAKLVEEHKKARTQPINDSLKLIRADYKPFEEQIETALKILEKKILAFQEELKAKALEQRQKLLANTDPLAEDKELDNKLADIDLQVKLTGGAYTKSVRELVITDEAIIPREYLTPDLTLIKRDLMKGKKISGAELKTNKIIAQRN